MTKNRKIKSATAMILMAIGIALIAIGYSLITRISGKGLDGFGTFILVILFMLSGAAIFVITLNIWLFGNLHKKYGLLMTIGIVIVGIFIVIYLTSEPFEVDISPTVMAKSLGGPVLPKSLAHWAAIDEIASEETIEILAVTAQERYGHPYFKIKYGNGKTGYFSGEHICADSEWVNGINAPCSTFDQQSSVKHYDRESNAEPIELVNRAATHLPGFWEIVDGDEEEPEILIISKEAANMGVFNNLGRRKRWYTDYRLHLEAISKTMMFIDFDRDYQDRFKDKFINPFVRFHIQRIDSLDLEVRKPLSGMHKPSENYSDEHKVIRYRRINVFEEPYTKNISPPIKAETIGGALLSESVQLNEMGQLAAGDPIELMAFTSTFNNGFPYFKIRTSDGRTGYMSGEYICANTKWITGVSNLCSSFEPRRTSGPVYSKSKEPSTDLIYRTYKYLPGIWEAVEDKGYDFENEPKLIFGKEAGDHAASIMSDVLGYPYYRLDFNDSSKMILFFINDEYPKGNRNPSFEISRIDVQKLEIYRYGNRYRYKRIEFD
ncbi:hypothetical protein JYB62_16685 [Algoriphagus lutimaris]|uniref:SH3 domain-containing protein n=1 Tax=Algoriphagus lutimaris TaxID=613197 RepID=UPI00196A6CE9|nr:SH3 domain-containing protein [Algoriphagus lutimaris]MBN3521650.1 hypothetical protein [Algoriphagus lutimaris]